MTGCEFPYLQLFNMISPNKHNISETRTGEILQLFRHPIRPPQLKPPPKLHFTSNMRKLQHPAMQLKTIL